MAMGGKAGELFTDINITPLTDVFLVLLVIMILIAPLVNQTVLKVDPPTPGANKPQDDKGPKIDVQVTSQGIIRVNGRPVNPPDSFGVATAIQAEQNKAGNKDLPLNLTSEGNALQRYVVAVMDAAAGCGIKQLRVLPIREHL
jgi:biopolymer transport protein ExbD/biopolymer transport protein TolR